VKKPGDFMYFDLGNSAFPEKIEITDVCNARQLALEYGFNLMRDVPVYVLAKFPHAARGSYSTDLDVIFFYPNTNEHTKKHEIVHSIECPQNASQELGDFFIKVKNLFPEGVEVNGGATFNFKKNIHELIADGYTHQGVIDALKQKGLYEEFLQVTKYMNILLEK
jgi:hypothetical protein